MKFHKALLRTWGAPVAGLLFLTGWFSYLAPGYGGFWDWPVTPALLVFTTVIALSARWGIASLLLIFGFLALQALHWTSPVFPPFWSMNLAVAVALFFIAYNASGKVRWATLLLAPIQAGAMAYLLMSRQYAGEYPRGFLWVDAGSETREMAMAWASGSSLLLVIMLACWFGGYVIRNVEDRNSLAKDRRVAETSLRLAEVNLIVEQERSRIARDLHDVLAHSLAAIVAQADGTRYANPDLKPSVQATMEAISSSARTALIDAQQVVERADGEAPAGEHSGLLDVEVLLGQPRESFTVERTETGSPVKLASGQELAVYRVVQESMTNVFKHGQPNTVVKVHFDWNGPGLSLQVRSRIRDSNVEMISEPLPSMRRGIPGMRERARLAGGWLTAEADQDEFIVTMYLPFETNPFEEQGVWEHAAGQTSLPSVNTRGEINA